MVGNSAVFKRGLKEVSEAADRRSGSREFHTEGTAVEKTHDAKHEATAVFRTYEQTDDDRSCLAIKLMKVAGFQSKEDKR